MAAGRPIPHWLPRPARGAGTLIPSAQRLVWAAKQALGEGMAIDCSILAWRIPRTGKPRGLLSMGSHRIGHD